MISHSRLSLRFCGPLGTLQIIVEDAESASSYNFRHALVREAFYEELLAIEVCPLHRRIAEHIETLAENEQRTIELAYHWWAAREPAKAVRYNDAAAEIAAARFASEDAVRYYDRALEFVGDGTLIQAELRDRQARQLWASSEGSRAIDVYERAFEYFERQGMTDRVVTIAHDLGVYHNSIGRGDFMMWFERALDAMGDNKAHPQRAKCLIAIAHYKILEGRTEQAHGYATASEESLFAAPPELRAHYFEILINLARVSGDFAAALAAYQKFRSEFDNPRWDAFAVDAAAMAVYRGFICCIRGTRYFQLRPRSRPAPGPSPPTVSFIHEVHTMSSLHS